MLNRTSEQQMHRIRWMLTIGWLLIIFSLFYDPLTSWLTDPANTISPIRLDPTVCVKVQGDCLVEQPYPIGARVFWAAVVPAGIFILFILGHEFWRRICPLSFLSQIPRALGLQRYRIRVNTKTGKTRKELVKVAKNSWLAKNYLALQFGLFYLGLCTRILFVNSDRLALGIFLVATIIASIYVGYLFGGKAWCQYFCPMAPVQKIYSEPRGLLNSAAHVDDRQKITQSMCRTVTQEGKDKPACVACQVPCIDIDSERSYWELITRPDQRWLYYGYFGLTVGFYVYYYLYAGTWDYYFSGVWTHEEQQLATLLNPGFYIAGHAIPIPKLIAVPLALGSFGLGSYWIGDQLEKRLKAYFLKRKRPTSIELIRHKMFTFYTFLVFNVFFMFGARPNLRLLPIPGQYLFTSVIAISSGLWLYRTWPRTPALYQREGLASRLRKQLRKINLDVGKFLEGRALDDLTADEVYVLAKVLPGFTHDKRLQAYRAILQESLEEGAMTSATSLDLLQNMRRELEITDEEHGACLADVGIDDPDLLNPDRQQSREDWLRLEGYRLVLAKVFGDRRRPAQGLGADLLAVAGDRKSLDSVQDLSLDAPDEALSLEDKKVIQQSREDYGITPEEENKLMNSL
ncbi:calcium-binding protein [Leptolyngbyaceae cyanobacterium CCMR0082]|uniref:Calcium-binding protein n=1 Tax=Adonisia turfae CCMR0082 TaxID=2304604 RepID=A0A6M0S913_9CYAN|nr:calcium-binding protein [Adonisia turfae]NEZ64910.1 calcium-binding protein [Adonisia turfae CCMR0082]